jgi:phosphatidylserine decarboxylase
MLDICRMRFPKLHGSETISRTIAKSFRHIPTNMISRFWGDFARSNASRHIIKPFSYFYDIANREAEKDLEQYATLNEFFTRRLKPGARPIDPDPQAVVSPVDGCVSSWGVCQKDRLLQIKGVHYDLFGLLRDGPMAAHFENGHYTTLYLSPQDYHRVHAPVDLEITSLGYMPGVLLPVNPPSVRWIPGLYTQNERIAIYADSPAGRVALVLVGAQCVGHISLTFSEFRSNRWGATPISLNFNEHFFVKKGEELGAFEMGSTVVMIFESDRVDLHFTDSDLPVRVGQRVALINREEKL